MAMQARRLTLAASLTGSLLLLFACSLTVPGCGGGAQMQPASFDEGQGLHQAGKHHEAVQALETFVRRNPTDSLAARAQYLKALSYLELKEYPLAAVELQILRKDFPTSDLVEDAFFTEGVAYYRQVGDVRRDVTGAQDARAHFQRFLAVFPDSRYGEEALEYLEIISDIFVLKQLNAAEVYRHLGRHDSVALVLDALLVEEPHSNFIDRVLLARARNALKTGEDEVAADSFRRLLADFPDSPLVPEARAGLERLGDAPDQ